MIILGRPLTFLQQAKICFHIHLFGEKVEYFSKEIFKTNDWNFQNIIKVEKFHPDWTVPFPGCLSYIGLAAVLVTERDHLNTLQSCFTEDSI